MKKFITTLLIAAFAFTSSLALAEKSVTKNPDIAWMYVLVSDKGKIVKSESGYTLVINRESINNILMFSDRPVRLTKQTSVNELEKSWKQGSNSFEKDPPNAAVVMGDQTQTVQLVGMKITPDSVNFSLKQDGMTPIQAVGEKHTVVFVDCTGLMLPCKSN